MGSVIIVTGIPTFTLHLFYVLFFSIVCNCFFFATSSVIARFISTVYTHFCHSHRVQTAVSVNEWHRIHASTSSSSLPFKNCNILNAAQRRVYTAALQCNWWLVLYRVRARALMDFKTGYKFYTMMAMCCTHRCRPVCMNDALAFCLDFSCHCN